MLTCKEALHAHGHRLQHSVCPLCKSLCADVCSANAPDALAAAGDTRFVVALAAGVTPTGLVAAGANAQAGVLVLGVKASVCTSKPRTLGWPRVDMWEAAACPPLPAPQKLPPCVSPCCRASCSRVHFIGFHQHRLAHFLQRHRQPGSGRNLVSVN
jgi:hypothetical protein